MAHLRVTLHAIVVLSHLIILESLKVFYYEIIEQLPVFDRVASRNFILRAG